MVNVSEDRPGEKDWLRGPGNQAEAEYACKRFGLDFSSPARAFENGEAMISDYAKNPPPDLFPDSRVDIIGIYLWYAASHGNRHAAIKLAEWIKWVVQNGEFREVDIAYFMQIAGKWDEIGENGLEACGYGHVAAAASVQQPSAAIPAGGGRGFSEPSSTGRASGHVIVKGMGDPKSTEGAALGKRFSNAIGVELPFRSVMPPPGKIGDILSDEWPWATHVARHLEGVLSVQRSVSCGRPSLRPLLFVGPPGSGKTALAVRIAELLGVPSTVIAGGGTADSSGLSAVTRGWSSSHPCGPVMAASSHGCCDPAIIVDELDKTASIGGKNGNVSGVLLGMLGNPAAFQDACLLADVDLSKMFFMATANNLGSIPGALLDRFSVLLVGRPKEEHFDRILEAMKVKVAGELGVRKEMLPNLDADEYGALKRHFVEGECSLREAERAYDFVLSEAVRRESEVGSMSH